MMIWDPDRVFFVIPYIDHPVTWYGVLFAFGFLVGYLLVRKIFTYFLEDKTHSSAEIKLSAIQLTDRLTFLCVLGTLIGARLGHVFFYGWAYYKQRPIDVFKIWEGGLASHGAAIGILIALLIFVWYSRKENPKLTFLVALDALMIPAAFAAGCIRIGNFINQEILGKPTDLPWAVTFLHPLDGPKGVPVHPVQLYESFFYFATFVFLYFLWKRNPKRLGSALFSGCFFLLVFGFRFLVEFVKWPQNDLNLALSTGQILSIPFIILGISLLVYSFLKYGRRV